MTVNRSGLRPPPAPGGGRTGLAWAGALAMSILVPSLHAQDHLQALEEREQVAAGLRGQPPQPAQPPAPLFRTSANVVRVDTLVTSRGKPVTGLTPADFELYDNGVLQEVTLASVEDLDVDVVLALDTSRSVRGALLQTLREAAAALVRTLRTGDRAAVITFASGVTVQTPLTTDHTAVERALEQVDARGGTSLIDATWAPVLLTHGHDRPTLVLLFSDGVDTASWLNPAPVLSLASRANLVADAIVVGSPRLIAAARRTTGAPPAGPTPSPPGGPAPLPTAGSRTSCWTSRGRPAARSWMAPADRASNAPSSGRCASSGPAIN